MREISIIIILSALLSLCCGCSPSFNGDVKLLKDDITVTKTDYMQYGPDEIEYQNYEISIPYVVDGTVKKDIEDIPVRYYLWDDHCDASYEAAYYSETDMLTKTMEASFTLKQGATDGTLTLKTDYTAMCMLDEPDTYPYIWASIQLDDDDNKNDFVVIHNPYFKGDFPGKAIVDFDYLATDGDFRIDEAGITLEQVDELDGVQHYMLSVPVMSEDIDEMSGQQLHVGMDFVIAGILGDWDISDGIEGALVFQEGVSYGFQETMDLEKYNGQTIVKLDVCNRHAGDPTGYDIDHFPYFWVALGTIDRNTNNNYYVLKNPFFDEDNPYCPDDVKYEYAYYHDWNARFEKLEEADEPSEE